MKIALQLSQGLRQEIKLSQVIEFNNLMAVPDNVLNVVTGAITYNPDTIETALQNFKREQPRGDSSTKVQNIYGALASPKGDDKFRRGGMIIGPDLRTLEECLGTYPAIITPDVTYIGRKDERPEVVFSDHLKDSIMLLLQIDQTKYPETSKLLARLKSFDTWKRGKLREAYVILGGEQREFIATLDPFRYNLFRQDQLADKMELSTSTISRILSNRWVEARNTEGIEKFLYAKDLFATRDDLNRYTALPTLNKILEEEFERKAAFSDREISERVSRLARRTVTKYREESKIPNFSERNRMYKTSDVTEPFKFI
ncbi:MAG: hypothetical protein V1645_00820 [archaeon]